MKVSIKNMVCQRCILVVRQEFEQAGYAPVAVYMGEVELARDLIPTELAKLDERLRILGFEILNDKNQKLIENIKTLLIGLVQSGEIEEHFSLSDFVATHLHKEYTQVSRLFSSVEGVTLEQFFILQKIEKVKEWLIYNELTLSEIAFKLGYSSVAHLSAQFKKVTGLAPSHFKTMGIPHRKGLDEVQPPK